MRTKNLFQNTKTATKMTTKSKSSSACGFVLEQSVPYLGTGDILFPTCQLEIALSIMVTTSCRVMRPCGAVPSAMPDFFASAHV